MIDQSNIENGLTEFLQMVRAGDFVVLDTETTGLERGEICQIAIVDSEGNTLLDTLVRTINPIPKDATRVHGISDQDCDGQPNWRDVSPQVANIIGGKHVVIYNAVYDRKMMHQSAEASGMTPIAWKENAHFWCAMEAFAEVYGDWNEYRGNYRWQKLATAARHYSVPDFTAHSAIGDCLTTLAVIQAMAKNVTTLDSTPDFDLPLG